MTGLRVGSLCSGTGALDLAVLSVLGGSVAWHAELDPAAAAVLAHHWPSVPNLGATRTLGVGEPRARTRRYAHEMFDEAEHAALLGQLCGCAAAVVLSGYPSDLYDDALREWDRVEFAAGTGQSTRGEWLQRTEVLWANRPISQPSLFDEEVTA